MYHPYCHSPSALTEYLKQKLHHQRAKRLGRSPSAQVEQNVPLKRNNRSSGYHQQSVPLNQIGSYDKIVVWRCSLQEPEPTIRVHTIPLRSDRYNTIGTDSNKPIQAIHIFTIQPAIGPHDTIYCWQFAPLNQMGSYDNIVIWRCSQPRSRIHHSRALCLIKKWPLWYHQHWL